MTTENWIHLFVSLPAFLTIILALIVSLKNKSNIQKIHLKINSRLDQWLKATKDASFAEGKLAEHEEHEEYLKRGIK